MGRGGRLFAGILGGLASLQAASTQTYTTPYQLVFTHSVADLSVQFDQEPWSNLEQQSSKAYSDWYIKSTHGDIVDQSWGPQSRQFPILENYQTRSPEFLRERVIYAGSLLRGLSYQHHHIPAFDPFTGGVAAWNYVADPNNPPAEPYWPWNPVSSGKTQAGLDCSNYVSWAYNYALGLKLPGDVHTASQNGPFTGFGGVGTITPELIYKEPHETFAQFTAKLLPGDILYIKGKNGENPDNVDPNEITHSIIWLGSIGQNIDPDATFEYLVMDSTGPGGQEPLHIDSDGNAISDGVQFRPFSESGENSWYYQDFAVAHRFIIPEPAPIGLAALTVAFVALVLRRSQ